MDKFPQNTDEWTVEGEKASSEREETGKTGKGSDKAISPKPAYEWESASQKAKESPSNKKSAGKGFLFGVLGGAVVVIVIAAILLFPKLLHKHSWKEASCTTPRTCSICGETEGEAKGHSWKEATCTSPKTCSTCGMTTGENLHESGVWEYGACPICGELQFADTMRRAKIGDRILFGHYGTDYLGYSEENQMVEWQVIDTYNGNLLLLATKVVDVIPYHLRGNFDATPAETWGQRKKSFSMTSAEKELIRYEYDLFHKWPFRSDDGFFTLSIEEAQKYLKDLTCKPNSYAKNKLIDANQQDTAYCKWWLQDYGNSRSEISYVDCFGEIKLDGGMFDDNNGIGIRPAVWIKIP